MSERMQWSEAEAVVRAYQTEQRLRTDAGAAPKRRFTDGSGLVSAALAATAAAAAIALAGPRLLASHPLLAALASKPTVIEAPLPPPTPTLARVIVRTPDGERGIVHLRSFLYDEQM